MILILNNQQLTPLQKACCRAKVMRRAFYEYMEAGTGFSVVGYKRLYSQIMKSMIAEMTDNQLRDILYTFLDCAADITAEEQAELLRLLHTI